MSLGRAFLRWGLLLFACVAILAAAYVVSQWGFAPPSVRERREAIGSLDGLPEAERRALEPGSDFDPIPSPGPDGWPSSHWESGQSYDAFVKSGHRKPAPGRDKIYLQPIGPFPEGKSPPLDLLARFVSTYFGLPVRILPALDLKGRNVAERLNPYTKKRQLKAADLMEILKAELPGDGYGILGITLEELNPAESSDFAFGKASPRDGVGVYSLARYDPAFQGDRAPRDLTLPTLRACKILTHETAHMLGLEHCVYFSCALNGSNRLEEFDSRPLHLCPVCLRKLKAAIGFDVKARYVALEGLYRGARFEAEADWTSKRLRTLGAASR